MLCVLDKFQEATCRSPKYAEYLAVLRRGVQRDTPVVQCCRHARRVASQLHISTCACAGEVMLTDYSLSTNTDITAEEVEEWMRSGPSSMTKWVSWQADWRLFDFDFLLEWGGRYGPALHQGQWWRWLTWGTDPLLVLPHPVTTAWVDLHEKLLLLSSSSSARSSFHLLLPVPLLSL